MARQPAHRRSTGLPLRLCYLHDVVGTVLRSLGFRSARAVTRAAASAAFDLDPPVRRAVSDAIRTALRLEGDPRQVERIARASFQEVASFWTELLYASRLLRGSAWRRAVEVPELAQWEALAGSGGPAICVTGYLGNPVVGALVLARLLGPLHVLVDGATSAMLHAYQQRHGLPRGVHPVHIGDASMRIPAVLQTGGRVLMLVGGRPRVGGLECEFLGTRRRHHASVARLARRHGARVVVFTCSRTGPGFRFELRMCDRFDASGGAQAVTTRMLAAIEAAIRGEPEQFLWSRLSPPAGTVLSGGGEDPRG